MSKFPKWQANYTPSPGGPVISAQPNAGQSGAALAGLGANIARVGIYLTREATEAAEKTAELDRIRQSSTVTRQATSELRKFADEIRRDPNPANYERRFEEVSQSILAGLDEIDDPEVRTRAQLKIDQELDFHHRDMLTWRMEAQQKAFEREYLQAEQDAVRTGNMEALQEPLQGLVEAGFIDEEQANRSWQVTEAKAQIWQTALAKGWKEGLQYATDPETLANLPLSPEERQAFKSELESYLRTEQTLAQIEARKQLAQIEQTKNNLFADARADKLDDPTQIDAALRAGVVSEAEAKQLQELVTKGQPTENDPQALIEINRMIDGIERGDVTTQQVVAEINRNASRLTPSKRDSLIERATNVFGFQNRALTDTRRYAITQLITVNESMLERLYAMGTATDVLKPIEDRRAFEYRLVEYVQDELGDWIRDHPDATPDDVQVQGRLLIAQVRDMEHAERQTLLQAWEAADLPPLETYDMQTRQRTPESAPVGLESIWGRMSDQDKAEALRLLGEGHRAQDLVEAFVP